MPIIVYYGSGEDPGPQEITNPLGEVLTQRKYSKVGTSTNATIELAGCKEWIYLGVFRPYQSGNVYTYNTDGEVVKNIGSSSQIRFAPNAELVIPGGTNYPATTNASTQPWEDAYVDNVGHLMELKIQETTGSLNSETAYVYKAKSFNCQQGYFIVAPSNTTPDRIDTIWNNSETKDLTVTLIDTGFHDMYYEEALNWNTADGGYYWDSLPNGEWRTTQTPVGTYAGFTSTNSSTGDTNFNATNFRLTKLPGTDWDNTKKIRVHLNAGTEVSATYSRADGNSYVFAVDPLTTLSDIQPGGNYGWDNNDLVIFIEDTPEVDAEILYEATGITDTTSTFGSTGVSTSGTSGVLNTITNTLPGTPSFVGIRNDTSSNDGVCLRYNNSTEAGLVGAALSTGDVFVKWEWTSGAANNQSSATDVPYRSISGTTGPGVDGARVFFDSETCYINRGEKWTNSIAPSSNSSDDLYLDNLKGQSFKITVYRVS